MLNRTRCAHCKAKFVPERPSQIVHVECIEEWTVAQAAKREREEAKKASVVARLERAEIRRRKQDMKRIPELIKDADRNFAAFIRERDRQAGFPCISSGRKLDWTGNAVDAGHYRSRGAASHLRYNEDNCHAQSKNDNRYKAGNVVDYRISLVKRIGIARVEAMEADNTLHKWTREELIEIAATYRRKLRELKAVAA